MRLGAPRISFVVTIPGRRFATAGRARLRSVVATIVAACLGLGVVSAQIAVPLGTEFRANSFVAGNQFGGSLDLEANGDFVIVWSSPQDSSQYGVFGQRYASSGARLGAEFLVNTLTTGSQRTPDVGADADGDFEGDADADGDFDGDAEADGDDGGVDGTTPFNASW